MLDSKINDNKICSDNKACLIGDIKVDTHFGELALLFFPATRNALIQTKLLEFYKIQAESISYILGKAKEIMDTHGVQISQLPPKIGLPILEKMSLETDDREMQDKWAQLLASATEDKEAINIYYADLLAKITSKEAKLLSEIYNCQIAVDGGDELEDIIKALPELEKLEYLSKLRDSLIFEFNQHFSAVFKNNALDYEKMISEMDGGTDIAADEKKEMLYGLYRQLYSVKNYDPETRTMLTDRHVNSKLYDEMVETYKLIDYLQELGLVKILFIDLAKQSIILTKSGFNFIKTLEGNCIDASAKNQ